MDTLDLTVILTPFGKELAETFQNLPALSRRLKTYFRLRPYKSNSLGNGKDKYCLIDMEVNETQFFGITDKRIKNSIQCTARFVSNRRGWKFSCKTVPNGYEVTRVR